MPSKPERLLFAISSLCSVRNLLQFLKLAVSMDVCYILAFFVIFDLPIFFFNSEKDLLLPLEISYGCQKRLDNYQESALFERLGAPRFFGIHCGLLTGRL